MGTKLVGNMEEVKEAAVALVKQAFAECSHHGMLAAAIMKVSPRGRGGGGAVREGSSGV